MELIILSLILIKLRSATVAYTSSSLVVLPWNVIGLSWIFSSDLLLVPSYLRLYVGRTEDWDEPESSPKLLESEDCCNHTCTRSTGEREEKVKSQIGDREGGREEDGSL